MNLKLFAVLSVLAVSSTASVTSAASSDGSISAEEAAIPLCNQTEQILISKLMTTNNRKKQCEATLGVAELVKATDKATLCSLTSCTIALQSLYVTLPDCKHLDWGVRYNIKRLLEHCGLNPEKVSMNPADYKDIDPPASSQSGSGKEEATVNWTDSSSTGTPSFAPIGGAVTPLATPVPTAAQQVTPATAAPKSAATSVGVAMASSAAAVVALVAGLPF